MLSSTRVLTTTWIDGAKMRNSAELEELVWILQR